MEELFVPDFTPKEMLEKGVFGGAYFSIDETFKERFPKHLFQDINDCKYDLKKQDKKVNYFGVLAGKSYEWWFERGLISDIDPLGWFEWYIHYYYGRRCYDDERQINRWINFKKRQSSIYRKLILKSKYSLEEINSSDNIYAGMKQSFIQWGIDLTNFEL